MPTQTEPESSPSFFSRYIPLMIWMLAALVGLLIPLKILSLGYMPTDDAMCHVAKAISGKAWPEILVMDPRFAQDEHPGWHAILGAFYHWFHWDADTLLFFEIAAPFVLFWLVVLSVSKRPESVMLVLLAGSVVAPVAFSRLLIGRPLVLMLVIYIALLHLWTRKEKISPWTVGLSILLIGLSVWVHGSWYLFGFVVAGFALADKWRKALAFGGCWLLGALLGAALTGHPFGYISETTVHLFNCFSGQLTTKMLVGELQPLWSDSVYLIILLALLWRMVRGEWQTARVWTPLLALAVLGWVLGFKIVRFWTDWGFPAALLWLIHELDEVLEARWSSNSFKSLVLAGLAAAAVFFSETGDVHFRWSSNLTTEYITPQSPGITGWLPDKGGIVYTAEMPLFFSMFYKNPTADWRYVLGFEPGIMTPENYAIYRKIQWRGAVSAFELWVEKMRPEDRMMIQQDTQPPINNLEWHCAIPGTWIGRLPQTNSIPAVQH